MTDSAKASADDSVLEWERVDALQRISHTGGWHWEIEADRVTGSDEFFRILGLEPQSRRLTRDAFLEFVHPDDREGAAAALGRAIRLKESYQFQHRIVRPDGAIRHIYGQADGRIGPDGVVQALYGWVHDITERRVAEEGLRSRARQQAAVARLGERSLAGAELEDVLRDAATAIRDTLGVEYTHILKLEPEKDVLSLRAAAGWPIGTVGTVRESAGPGTQGGYTLASAEPVIVPDIRTEERFETPQPLTDAGVISGINVLIPGGGAPWGIVSAHSTRAREFTDDDANFLRAVANLVGASAARLSAEDAIRRSEERFRLMVEVSEEVFFYEHDTDHRFTYLSPSLVNVLGYRPEELLGTPCDGLLSDDADQHPDRPGSGEHEPAGSQARTFRAAVSHRDGRQVVLEVMERPLIGREGVTGFQGLARDMTERDRADEALRSSEEYFRALIEDAPELIAVVDGRLLVRYLSPAYTHLLGHDPDDLLGSSILQVIHPDDASRVYDTFGRLLDRPGATASAEVRVRHGNGSWRLLQARAKNLIDVEAVGGIVVNAHDITEHRMLQNRFERAQKMEAVGRLAGGVAHDFNNALTAVGGYARFILDSLEEGHPLRSDAAEILSAAEHATGVVRQLLAFSRTQVRQPVALDLNRVVLDFQMMLRHLVGADVELVVEADADRPVVRIDRTQVEQVLVNLAVNARDAMPEGGTVRIATSVVEVDDGKDRGIPEPGRYARLTVTDTGVGMSTDVLEHLFEPFFTTKEPGRGTGLGLSTVYGIVVQNGGHISCDSRPGEGTRFAIWLPASATEEEIADPAPSGRQPHEGAVTGEVVLLVEDEAAVRALARRILEGRGYGVLEARDGVEALEVAANHGDDIDLLLTDVVMPRLGGRDLARRLAERRPEMRALFMSGYAESEIAHRGLLVPGIAFLEKPFTADALAAAVRSVLDADARTATP